MFLTQYMTDVKFCGFLFIGLVLFCWDSFVHIKSIPTYCFDHQNNSTVFAFKLSLMFSNNKILKQKLFFVHELSIQKYLHYGIDGKQTKSVSLTFG